MTPEQKPFYAGTYFPKNSRDGMPGLMGILKTLSDEWKNNKSKVISSSEGIFYHLDKFFNDKQVEKSGII